jgi:hypothetical protein
MVHLSNPLGSKTVLQKLMVEIYTRLAHRYIKNDLLHPLGWFLKMLIDTIVSLQIALVL